MKKRIFAFVCSSFFMTGIFISSLNRYEDVFAASISTDIVDIVPVSLRVMGIKENDSREVYLTNNLGADIKALYIKDSASEAWGKSLVPIESVINAEEKVHIYYKPNQLTEDSDAVVLDLKIVMRDNAEYQIYQIDFDDMKDTAFVVERDDEVTELKYTSLSEMNEKVIIEYIPSSESVAEELCEEIEDDVDDCSGYYCEDSYDDSDISSSAVDNSEIQNYEDGDTGENTATDIYIYEESNYSEIDPPYPKGYFCDIITGECWEE